MDSKPDPTNSVLSTPELREMVLKKLDILSLLNCRLVSKSWNATASSALKKRTIWIRREWDSQKFHGLYKCVRRSINFPFSRLDLSITSQRAKKIDYDYAVKLFVKFGDLITHLRAEECSVKWHMEMMSNLLKIATKLEYLQVGTLPSNPDAQNPQFAFPSLRILSFQNVFHGKQRILREVIRAAPKLQEIRHVRCSSTAKMAALRKTRKLSSVSSLTFSASIETRIYSELAVNPPQLTALTVEDNGLNAGHVRTALKSILKQSEKSLKKLKFVHCFKQLDDLPVLHVLEELDLSVSPMRGYVNGGMSGVLPLLSNTVFPKLKTVRVNGYEKDITEDFIRKHFWEAYDAPLESVDKLELATYCEPPVIEYMAKLFPRVTYISVGYMCNLFTRGNKQDSNIWLLKAFQHLTKLEILGYAFKYGSMDTFLTGIPKEIVAKMRTAPKQILSSCMSEILRPDGNILQLKNLRELTIIMAPSRSPLKPSSENPFMTMVSVWYGLEMMPGLQATFLYCSRMSRQFSPRDHPQDLQEAFEPVKDCVTIGKCHCETH